MFLRPSTAQKVLMPYEAFAVIHPDLPLWLRHRQSVQGGDAVLSLLPKGEEILHNRIQAEDLIYSFKNSQASMSIPVEIILEKAGGIKIGYNWHQFKNHYKDQGYQQKYTADIGAKFSDESEQGSVPDGHILIDNIQFSSSLVEAIQEHFEVKENINTKLIAERFLYFMMIAVLMRSKNMDLGVDGNTKKLMLCLQRCGEHIENLMMQYRTTLEQTFFRPCNLDGSAQTYLYFQPETATRLVSAVRRIGVETVPGFSIPEAAGSRYAPSLKGEPPALLSAPDDPAPT